MNQTTRDFTTIQKAYRIALNREFRERLGWKEGDQLLLEIYDDKRIIVENLTRSIPPLKERL